MCSRRIWPQPNPPNPIAKQGGRDRIRVGQISTSLYQSFVPSRSIAFLEETRNYPKPITAMTNKKTDTMVNWDVKEV
jgi:hypothetical protein